MSGEDTELTFIRCPSCRSLVPAVATRCRMCGHQFSSQESSSVDSTKNKVKQRVDEPPDTDIAAPVERNVLYSEPEESEVPSFSTEPEYEDLAEDISDDGDDEEGDDDFLSQQGASNGSEALGGVRRKRRRRRKKKPGQQSEQAAIEPVRQIAEPVRSEPVRQEPVRQYVETPQRVVEAPQREHQRAERHEQPRASKPVEVGAAGVLVGWLVNYAQNSTGAAIEIRSGKYFVARQRLRDDDLVIPDSAISTPHCLIKASKGAIQIQDLMSEQGTFVKKSGSSAYVPVEEAGIVEHGDRVKFGAFEVVVCLVP